MSIPHVHVYVLKIRYGYLRVEVKKRVQAYIGNLVKSPYIGEVGALSQGKLSLFSECLITVKKPPFILPPKEYSA